MLGTTAGVLLLTVMIAAEIPGSAGNNLEGKMVTMSSTNNGGVTFYPYGHPLRPTLGRTATARPGQNTTSARRGRSTAAPPGWTNPHPKMGVSVCLRFIKEAQMGSIFQLDPGSSGWLRVDLAGMSDGDWNFWLSLDGHDLAYMLTPNLRIWPNLHPEIWNRLCLVLDSVKSVVQLYSGSYMSARKLIALPFSLSGRPVIGLTDFDGQVTDLQMWDYPIGPNVAYDYMTGGTFGLATGNVLTWSNIAYSASGRILMEDSYLTTPQEEAGQGGGRMLRHKPKKRLLLRR